MKKINVIIISLLIALSSVILTPVSHAQINLDDSFDSVGGVRPDLVKEITTGAGSAEESAGLLLERVAQILLGFAATIALFFIIYAGFQLIKARGDEEAVKKAHQTLFYALIGVLLTILAYALVINLTSIIFSFLGG